MTATVSDTYGRTVVDGFGSATTGQAYAVTAPATDFDVNTGVGTIQPSATNSDRLAIVTADAGSDHVVSSAVRWGTLPATGVLRAGVVPRFLDGGNFYWGEIVVNAAGAVTVRAQKRSGGTMTALATFSHPTAYVAGAFWTVKSKMAGRRIQVKAWTGAVEPAWQVDFTDTAEAPATGTGIGVYARNETTTPVVTHVASFDNLAADPAITVAQQFEWPPRTLVTVTDLTVGDTIALYRGASNVSTLIRGGSATATDVSFLVVDAELPFGVPVAYTAIVNGTYYNNTPAVTYTLTGGKVALSDAVGGQSAEVVIRAWPEKTYDRRASRFRAGGRNIVVAGELAGYSGTLELFTETTPSRDNVAALLDGATEGVIQIRQPGGYDGVDSYVAVTGWTERRFSQDGTDQRRTLLLDVVEVEGWAPALEARGYTLQDVADAYTGLTLANLGADYATLLALAQASF